MMLKLNDTHLKIGLLWYFVNAKSNNTAFIVSQQASFSYIYQKWTESTSTLTNWLKQIKFKSRVNVVLMKYHCNDSLCKE